MRSDPNLLLGRVMIAAAWADGELTPSEREALEDLLFAIPDLDPETWRALRADLERPRDHEHRAALEADLLEGLRTEEDRSAARETLRAVAQRFGEATAEARSLDDVIAALGDLEQKEQVGWFAKLGRSLGGELRRHASFLRDDRRREQALEERLSERLERHWPETVPRPSSEELHRLALGSAILAHVVRLDDVVEAGEVDALRASIVEHWGLAPETASLATELALDESAEGLDLHSLLRQFQAATDEDERQRFLAAVFRVAAGDGRASYDEIEEVRRIGRGLLLSHRHFIAAKLSLPRGDRET